MGAEASVLDRPRRRLLSGDRTAAIDAVLLIALTAAVTLVFALLHRQLVIQSDEAQARVLPYAVASHPGRDAIAFSFGPFLAVLLGSTFLAASRHRIAAFGVFALTAITPLLQAVLHVLPADRGSYFRVAPTPLGIGWIPFDARPQLGQLWRAAGIDYGLALLPAIAITAWTVRAEPRRPGAAHVARAFDRVRAATRAEIAGLASAGFLFWLVLHTWELRETLHNSVASGTGTDAVAYLPFFLLGVVLARGSRWRFAALAAVPILWSTLWIPQLLAGDGHGPSWSDAHQAIPYLAVVGAGWVWRPIATAVGDRRERVWVLVAALDALNVADVLFTHAALHSGGAVEANPFATWIGPGLKLCGVAAASALLARYRPRALIWLVLVFGALIAWHLSGLILDTS